MYILLLILLLFIFLINNKEKYINNPNIKNNNIKNNNIKNEFQINKINCQKNLLTKYDCFINNCDMCPMSSFKQCSNNYSYKVFPPNINCNCYNRSYELCSNKYSQKCLLKNKICNKFQNMIPSNYSQNNIRINIWQTDK